MDKREETPKPPKIPEWLLSRSLDPRDREAVLGDFAEFYEEAVHNSGPAKALWWYCRQVLKSLPRFAANTIYWSQIMIRNYLRITLRHLRNNKVNAFINIGGLAMGLACCILIFFFVRHEWSFDRFHENYNRIFEVKGTLHISDSITAGVDAQPPLGPTLFQEFPEILDAVRITPENLVFKQGARTSQEKGLSADPSFFKIFSFPLKFGAFEDALQDPQSVVLSESLALRYFRREDPVGETVTIQVSDEFQDFRVAGIAEAIPSTSSLQFDFVLNVENLYGDELHDWKSGKHLPTFVLLSEKAQAEILEKKFPDTIDLKFRRNFSEKSGYKLQAFAGYHLFASRDSVVLQDRSKPVYSYILAGIALLVLLIACINFMNLSIGSASQRLKEVGLRKVLGAERAQLIRQFWFESLFLSFAALLLGVFLVELFLPTFRMLTHKSLHTEYFGSGHPWLVLVGLAVFVGALSGGYPAFVLSGFDSVSLFRGRFKFSGKNVLSKTLIVMQFAISVLLIVSTLVMARQYFYLVNKDLGFDSDSVLVLSLDNISPDVQVVSSFVPNLKQRLLQHQHIHSVAGAKYGMTTGFWMSHVPELQEGGRIRLDYNAVDYDYLETLGIELIAGRDFSPDFPSDLQDSVIVNEAFVKQFGFEDPIGHSLSEPFKGEIPGNIVGIVKDFHYEPLYSSIHPAYIKLARGEKKSGAPPPAGLQNKMRMDFNPGFKLIYVKASGQDLGKTIAGIKTEFADLAPDIPFNYTFLDERVAQQYAKEQRWGRIVNYASLFAILLACSGLFGLSLFTVVRRTKEIGVRKVLGASVLQISQMINREFIWLVLIANVIAWPAAYFSMHTLLQNYAYRVTLGPWPFLLAGLLAAVIAVLTISFHAVKAARTNPVDSLRFE